MKITHRAAAAAALLGIAFSAMAGYGGMGTQEGGEGSAVSIWTALLAAGALFGGLYLFVRVLGRSSNPEGRFAQVVGYGFLLMILYSLSRCSL